MTFRQSGHSLATCRMQSVVLIVWSPWCVSAWPGVRAVHGMLGQDGWYTCRQKVASCHVIRFLVSQNINRYSFIQGVDVLQLITKYIVCRFQCMSVITMKSSCMNLNFPRSISNANYKDTLNNIIWKLWMASGVGNIINYKQGLSCLLVPADTCHFAAAINLRTPSIIGCANTALEEANDIIPARE